MKEFIIFVCTDSALKLRSASLYYNLPSFFTDSYCAGVSNKHCLLTFFIGLENQILVFLRVAVLDRSTVHNNSTIISRSVLYSHALVYFRARTELKST